MGMIPNNKHKNSFRLSDEARAEIDREFLFVPERHISKPEVPEEGGDIPHESENTEEVPKKRKRHWRRRIITGLIVLCAAIIITDIFLLFLSGRIWFNEPKKRDYPIRGPVISEKEGEVQWRGFAAQNIQICYIRATKGVSYEDKRFEYNKEGSGASGLPTGMIHVFDPLKDGEKQAEHFIKVCGGMGGRLRPVVDCDFGLIYSVLPVDEEKVSDRLRAFADKIKEKYGCTPIIKCDKDSYEKIAGKERFDDCGIWYVSEFKKIPDGVRADLWGYSSRVKFKYYESGGFLEMVVLNSGEEDYSKLTIKGE